MAPDDAGGVLRAPWRLLVFAAAAVFGMVVAHNVVYPLVAGTSWFVARLRLELDARDAKDEVAEEVQPSR